MEDEVYCKPQGVSIPRRSCENRREAAESLKRTAKTPALMRMRYELADCFDCPGHAEKKEEVKNMGGKKVCTVCGNDADRVYAGKCAACRQEYKKAVPERKTTVPSAEPAQEFHPAKKDYREQGVRLEGAVLTIDFTNHPDTYAKIVVLAEEEMRPPEMQALRILKDKIDGLRSKGVGS